MRAVTLKAAGDRLALLIGYYEGLAQDQVRRDGAARGPVDYYLDPGEPPGRWWGSGWAAVGLDGEVLPEQLQALLEGRHPATGATLGRRFGDQSARGFDATFSAAKSVSVLWALNADPWVRAEVTAAHDAAVVAALGWLERHQDGHGLGRRERGVEPPSRAGLAGLGGSSVGDLRASRCDSPRPQCTRLLRCCRSSCRRCWRAAIRSTRPRNREFRDPRVTPRHRGAPDPGRGPRSSFWQRSLRARNLAPDSRE
jgi:hypothetical protein